jgi:BirA family biotin operon repressor/biotin-[acetyl-CoA-carboxylase] ligase
MAAFIPVPTSRAGLFAHSDLAGGTCHRAGVWPDRVQRARPGLQTGRTFEWLDVASVRDALSSPAAETFTLAVTERTDSTNSQLMARAASGGLHGLVLAAEMQSAGRGRLGRRWQTRLGAGLTFSLLWRFDRGLAELAGLSLAVGLALARLAPAGGAGTTQVAE